MPATRLSANEQFKGYCIRCEDDRTFVGTIEPYPNNRRLAKGNCTTCGMNITRTLDGS